MHRRRISGASPSLCLPPDTHTRALLDAHTQACTQVSRPTRPHSPLVLCHPLGTPVFPNLCSLLPAQGLEYWRARVTEAGTNIEQRKQLLEQHKTAEVVDKAARFEAWKEVCGSWPHASLTCPLVLLTRYLYLFLSVSCTPLVPLFPHTVLPLTIFCFLFLLSGMLSKLQGNPLLTLHTVSPASPPTTVFLLSLSSCRRTLALLLPSIPLLQALLHNRARERQVLDMMAAVRIETGPVSPVSTGAQITSPLAGRDAPFQSSVQMIDNTPRSLAGPVTITPISTARSAVLPS